MSLNPCDGSAPNASLALSKTDRGAVPAGAVMLTLADTVQVTRLGISTIYTLIESGKIVARKAGTRTLVEAESLRAYLAGLPPAVIRRAPRKPMKGG